MTQSLETFLSENPHAILIEIIGTQGSTPREAGTFMLPISVLEALSMAVASVADYRVCPRLDAPATPERVLMAVERLKGM